MWTTSGEIEGSCLSEDTTSWGRGKEVIPPAGIEGHVWGIHRKEETDFGVI